MINSMYSEMILEHNKSGHNKRELSTADYAERGHNPNCGDDLTLLVKMDGNIIADASFLGSGCAISQASMSMMIDYIKGKTLDKAKATTDIFLNMIKTGDTSEEDEEVLEDFIMFKNLSNMPARVKCGTLGWHCLKVVIDKNKDI